MAEFFNPQQPVSAEGMHEAGYRLLESKGIQIVRYGENPLDWEGAYGKWTFRVRISDSPSIRVFVPEEYQGAFIMTLLRAFGGDRGDILAGYTFAEIYSENALDIVISVIMQ